MNIQIIAGVIVSKRNWIRKYRTTFDLKSHCSEEFWGANPRNFEENVFDEERMDEGSVLGWDWQKKKNEKRKEKEQG